MPQQVPLYDNAYANYESNVYRQVRIATYGEDLGQTSWVTAEESDEIPKLLGLSRDSTVLEIGCGSGRYALRLAARAKCRVVGLDINAHAIRTANEMAQRDAFDSLVRFEQCDLANAVPFEDCAFHAAFANDSMCHIPGRLAALCEVFRVLKPGGRFLFSDALVIGGLISHEEIATRSSIGHYVFSPLSENERLVRAAGFRLVQAMDTTEAAAGIAKRWHDARDTRRDQLLTAEGEPTFQGVQRFLSAVHTLTSERRLLRYLYLAAKEA